MRALLLASIVAGPLACGAPPVRLPTPAPPGVDVAIAAAVAQDEAAGEATWPRPPEPEAARAPTTPERRLGRRICSGHPGPKERPHTAACCYPAKELLVGPLRSLFPRLRGCYEARKKKDAHGSVAFTARIEQHGAVVHACASEASTMDDEDAVTCMVEALRTLHYPASSDADVALCGLVTITYPISFEP